MMQSSIQGDSTTPEAYARVLAGQRADALITDPPYSLLTRRRKHGDERDKKDRKIERGPLRRFEDVKAYRQFTRAWLGLATQHLTPLAPLVIWSNLLGREPISTVAAELGWSHRLGEFVWGKRTREGNSGEEILRVVETALVFSRTAAPGAKNDAPAVPWAVVAGYDDDGDAQRWGSHPSHKPFQVIGRSCAPGRSRAARARPLRGQRFDTSRGAAPGPTRRGDRAEPEWAERVTERLGRAEGSTRNRPSCSSTSTARSSPRRRGRKALERASGVLHGRPDACASFSFAGMTDPAIIRRGLLAANVAVSNEAMEAVCAKYLEYLHAEVGAADDARYRVHRGMREAVQAGLESGAAVGLAHGQCARGRGREVAAGRPRPAFSVRRFRRRPRRAPRVDSGGH